MTEQQARIEVLKKCKEDLIFFGKTIKPKTFYLESPHFHTEMSELMMNRSEEQVCILAPRGFAKSTLGVFMILHHILFDAGDKVIVIQSKTQPEAINRLTSIKNILEYSKPFRDLFGYAGENVATKWTEKNVRSHIGGNAFSIRCIGTGMPARGALESSESLDDTRITLYYLDDPDDEQNTLTKEQMEKNYDKFAGSKEGLDKRTGRVIVVGTLVRQGCIVDRLYGSKGWVSKLYKARDDDGNLLWKEMRDNDWLDAKFEEYESQGKISKYYSEFMNEIVGDADQLFKEEYIQYWDGHLDVVDGEGFIHITHLGTGKDSEGTRVLKKLEEEIVKPVTTYIGVDPASSTKRTADYSVTFPIAYDGYKIYVLPYFRKRVTPTAHADQIIETIRHLSPTRGHIETVGYQEMLRDYLRNRLMEEDLYLPGIEKKFNPRTEKSERLETLHSFFYNKRVYIKPDMNEFLDELLMYPRGRHDDTLDGFYYATRKLLPPRHESERKEIKTDLRHFIIPEKANGWQTR